MSSKPHFDGDSDEINSENGVHTFKPRAFNIVWGNDSRYWRIPNRGESGPAELVQVSWLEVTGSLELPPGKYEITFSVSLKPDAFGWSGYPIFMMAKVGKKGRYSWKRVKPFDQNNNTPFVIPEETNKFEIEVTSTEKLYFGLYEVWSGKWKGGLQIHNAVVKKVN